jgi:nucleoside-diphosphate-sugar epimerase
VFMKKFLVIGASGGMGSAIVRELAAKDNYEVVAFARTESKLRKLFHGNTRTTIVPGDAFQIEDLLKAATGVDTIIHAMNIPYSEWEQRLPALVHTILLVAREVNTRLVVVDNIYGYGKSDGKKVTEQFPRHPHTKKGKIRLALEEMVRDSGIPYLIVHFPDFYGPEAGNTLLYKTFEKVIQKKRTIFVGNPHIPREYIYTPDGAKALVELAERDGTFGQDWNVPGAGVIRGTEILKILHDWGFEKGMTTIRKPLVRMAGLFDSNLREYVEMFYLNEQPVVLCGDKLNQELGYIPRTSYRDGIFHTLDLMVATKGRANL